MLMRILYDRRRALLLKEERILSLSLSDIFALSPKDLKELQVSERLGAPSFMRIDERRWCQASILKEGRSFRPRFSLAGKPGDKERGKLKIKGGDFKNVNESKKSGFTLIELLVVIAIGSVSKNADLRFMLYIKNNLWGIR
jgi:prepilin-type N-terminal cleavage/methylation domain-containing protein